MEPVLAHRFLCLEIYGPCLHDGRAVAYLPQIAYTKAIIDMLVSDCIEASEAAIAAAGIASPADACARPENLITLSDAYDRKLETLETFLLERFYHHERLVRNAEQARQWLTDLFERLCARPEQMPSYFQRFIDQHGLQRAVCDYIAGMTDRYCLKTLARDDR